MLPVALAQSPLPRRLPVRDGDVWMYAVAGIALLLVGTLFIYLARRRR
jgi:LPXTG-motif cell wall-anchored protein